METARAMVHSKNSIEEVEIIKEKSANDMVVITRDGVKCTAIFNCFNGLIYADDIYGIIKE